jgi:hypothetical protein
MVSNVYPAHESPYPLPEIDSFREQRLERGAGRCQSHVASVQKVDIEPVLSRRMLGLLCTIEDRVIRVLRALYLQLVPTDLIGISAWMHTLSKIHTDRLHRFSLI